MLDKSQLPLGIKLNQEIQFLPQGHPLIPNFADQLPDTWLQALMAEIPPDEVVEFLWQPVTPLARGFVFRLASITMQLGLVISSAEGFQPYLFYAQNESKLGRGWLGGIPAKEADLNRWEQDNAISLPASYRQFAQLHNGFLENDQGEVNLYPLQELSLLTMPNKPGDSDRPGLPGSRKVPRLLAFASLKDDKLQCYDLNSARRSGDALTVQCGHPAGEFFRPQSFWSFLKDFTIQYL